MASALTEALRSSPRKILSSFYSAEFYSAVANEEEGRGTSYVIILTVIMLCIISLNLLRAGPEILSGFKRVTAVMSQLPAVTYKDYTITIDKPAPYQINAGTNTEPRWIIIDPEYTIANVDTLTQFMREKQTIIVLANDNLLVLNEREDRVDITDLKNWRPFTITHDDWHRFADIVSRYGMVLLIGLCILLPVGLFFGNFCAAIVVAVVVKMVGRLMRAELDFNASLRVAAALRIPVTILAMLPLLVVAPDPKSWLVLVAWVADLQFGTPMMALEIFRLPLMLIYAGYLLTGLSQTQHTVFWLIGFGYLGFGIWASKHHFNLQR